MAEGVAITARRLRRLEAWSDWQANGGSRQSVVDDAIAARASITLENEQLSVTLPLDSPAITALGARKIIRVDQEDARTNFVRQSQNFNATEWAKVVVGTGTLPVVTTDATADPNGNITADKVVFAVVGGTDQSQLIQDSLFTTTIGASYTGSIYVKAFAAGDIGKQLLFRHVGRVTYTVITLTAGWVPITAVEAAATVNGYFEIGLRPSQGGSSGTVSAYLWQGQIENGKVRTAPILTTTAAVTVDAIFDEYRILERAVDDLQGVWAITAAPLRLTDLGGSGLISRKDSDGVVVYDFEVLGLTPTEVITNWVLPSLAAAGFGWISIGTITPTARLDMTFAWDTPLSVLLRLSSATTCELDLRKSGAGYVIDLVSKINSAAQRADLRIDKNLVNVTRSESSIDQATRIFPKGSAQDGMAATMADARWQVTAVGAGSINSALWSRDLTNAVWINAGLGTGTAVQNAVGIDGNPNSATTITDTDATAYYDRTQSWTVPNDNSTHVVEVRIAKDANQTRFPEVAMNLGGGTAQSNKVQLNTQTGVAVLRVQVGVHFFSVVDRGLWWGLVVGVNNNTTGNTQLTLNIYPARATTIGGAVVTATGSIVVGQVDLRLFSLTVDAPIFTGAAAVTSSNITLADPAGGVGPIVFDNQLAFKYLRRVDGSLVQVGGSVATTDVLTVMGNTGIAVNDLVEFRADSAGGDLTYLEDPAAVLSYGIKAAVRDVSDVPATNNLVKNPAMRAWPGSSSAPPTNWTAVGAPTIAKQTAAPFTAIGGNSIKVTGTADAQGVISDAVTIFPTATNPYLSGYAKVWVASGNARVELVITTPTGTKIFPLLPDLATPTSLGQWFDVGAAGFDANAVAATAAQIRIVQNGTTASVFYVDAAQITATATQQPWFEGSGGTRLWQEANEALRTGSNPVVSFTVPLVDLEAYDSVTWSESALIIGANARIVDPRLGIDIITRIVGIERDYIQPENIAVTLSTRFDDLTDILASSSRPTRDPGSSAAPATIPQQPKLTITFDINGQAIINSIGDNDVVSQKIAMGTSAPSAATVRAQTAINQQNLSNYATGTTFAQGTVVFVGAFAYDAAGLESSPLLIVSGARQGAIIDYTPFASTLAPIAILASLPGTGAFVGQIVFLTTDKKLYRWDGATWSTAVAAVDITGTINTAQIAAGAVTATQLGAAAVTAGKIAASAVGSTEIAALAITNAKIAANAVDTAKLAASAVTTTELAALAVTGAKIAALTITAGNIAAHTISANEIAALTITAAEISAGAITAAKIAVGAITAGKISVGTGGAALNSDPSTTDLTAWDFAGGGGVGSIVTLTDGKVGSTAIRSIATGSYYNSHRQPYDPAKSYRVRGWVRRDATANGVLYLGMGVYDHAGAFADISGNYFYIAAAGVTASTTWTEYSGVLPANRSWNTTPETMALVALLNYTGTAGYMEVQDFRLEEVLPGTLIQDGAIITNKLAANAVTAGKIAADTITASEIAAGAITSSELAAGSVIAGKIAALTIVAADIAAATITGAKIAANTISASNIVANTITAGQIQAGAISATEIAAGAITTAKIAAGAVTANEISAGTITADRIVAGSITTTQLAPITVTCSLRDTTTPTRGSAVQAGLTWDTEDFDAFGLHTTNGTAITTDSAGGLVIIHAVIRWPSSNLLGIRELRLFKNSTQLPEVRQDTRSTFNAGQLWQEYTWYDASVSGGDFWEVVPYQDSGSTIAVEGKRFTFIHARI